MPLPRRFSRRAKPMKDKTIEVDYLARVEGEGALYVKVRKGEVLDVRLKIFEPPRFFEAILRGRDFSEAPDITSRICGICPIAYQMSAVHAMENACAVEVEAPVRALRRLIYCGEWIESHALHVYLLHAPDFLGAQDAVRLARRHPGLIERGLELKKTGNALISLLGGRSIHPVNVRLGGFHRLPTRADLQPLAERLRRAREGALETVRWTAGFPFPEFERDYEFVALRHPDEYPINAGRIVSSRGLDIPIEEYEGHFVEEQVPHSTALHSRLRTGGAYFVGPLARFNLNFDRLSPLAKEAAHAAGLGTICRNPFKGVIVRSVELLYACDEALRIIEAYEPCAEPAVGVPARDATGYACTEAPRGLLYHRYRIEASGALTEAKIVPPTSQNQRSIEEDLRHYVEKFLRLPKKELTWRCEQVIRNYDPCISCSTHFLKLQLDRS